MINGRSFKYRIEYYLLRALSALVSILPYRAALAIAWFIARVMFHVVRFRRRETLRRIRSVFPEKSEKEIRRIAWISLRNLCFNGVEMILAPKVTRAWVDRHMPGFAQTARAALADGVAKHGGLILAVPHMGNWDLAGIACARCGLDVFSIAAKQRNEFVNDWMNRQRASGMVVLERGSSALIQIIRRLRAGGIFAILPDVRAYDPEVPAPFLGGVANLARGMAMFAISAKVPVQPAILTRIGWTRHEAVALPAIVPDFTKEKNEEAQRITAAVIAGVDRAIRADPGQWFWYNRRWILDPVKQKGG